VKHLEMLFMLVDLKNKRFRKETGKPWEPLHPLSSTEFAPSPVKWWVGMGSELRRTEVYITVRGEVH
jgi:hypothetical protein